MSRALVKEDSLLLHRQRRRIQLAEIRDPLKQSGDRVLFGATVTVDMPHRNEEFEVQKIEYKAID